MWEVCSSSQTGSANQTKSKVNSHSSRSPSFGGSSCDNSSSQRHSRKVSHRKRKKSSSVRDSSSLVPRPLTATVHSNSKEDIDVVPVPLSRQTNNEHLNTDSCSDQRELRSRKTPLTSPNRPNPLSSPRLRSGRVIANTDPDYKPSIYNQRKCELANSTKKSPVKTPPKKSSPISTPPSVTSTAKKTSPIANSFKKTSPVKTPPSPRRMPSSVSSTAKKTSPIALKKTVAAMANTKSKLKEETKTAATLPSPKQSPSPSLYNTKTISSLSPKAKHASSYVAAETIITGNSETKPVANSQSEDFIGSRTRQRQHSANLNQTSPKLAHSLLPRSVSSSSISKLLSINAENSKSPTNHKYPTRHKPTGNE